MIDQNFPTQRPLKRPFSPTTRNSTKFADNVIRGYLGVLAKFEVVLTNTSEENHHNPS